MTELMSMVRSRVTSWAAVFLSVWFPELAFNLGLKLVVSTLREVDADDAAALRADLMRSLVLTSVARPAR